MGMAGRFLGRAVAKRQPDRGDGTGLRLAEFGQQTGQQRAIATQPGQGRFDVDAGLIIHERYLV
jgi:hypothetical protein